MQNVSWRIDGKYILKDINWTVNKGEHWAIIGLNGSGKTSLLNLITGYNWPSKGEISVLGKHFGDYDIRELRKRIGLVSSFFQEKFYAAETAEEIVLSGKFATIGLYDRTNRKDAQTAVRLLRKNAVRTCCKTGVPDIVSGREAESPHRARSYQFSGRAHP